MLSIAICDDNLKDIEILYNLIDDSNKKNKLVLKNSVILVGAQKNVLLISYNIALAITLIVLTKQIFSFLISNKDITKISGDFFATIFSFLIFMNALLNVLKHLGVDTSKITTIIVDARVSVSYPWEKMEALIEEVLVNKEEKFPIFKEGPEYIGIENFSNGYMYLRFVGYCKGKDRKKAIISLNKAILDVFSKINIDLIYPQQANNIFN